MKLLIRQIFSLVISSLIIFVSGGRTLNHGSMIQNVFDKFISDGVIMGSTRNYFALSRITISHQVSRDMSARGVLSVVVNFMQLGERLKFYRGRIYRPLVVILIGESDDLHIFQNATVTMDMSYPVWLVLFTDDEDKDSCKFCRNPIGNPFNLKFNSEMLVSCCNSRFIGEFWSETGDSTNKVIRGHWIDEINGIDWYRNASFYNRRHLKGMKQLRIVVVEGSRYVWKESGQLHGFLGRIVDDLRRVMNFTHLKVIEKSSYGTFSANISKWTGAIGVVARGEVHLGAGEFTMTTERLKAVEFTLPFALGKNKLWFKKPRGSVVYWDAYFKALHPEIWTVIIALLIITPLLLTIMKYKRKHGFFNMIAENYLDVWGIFCQQALSKFPEETSLRTAYISIFISAIIISAAYSGSLISYLATSSSYSLFNTIEEFANDGTYKLIVFKDSADYEMFEHSNDTVSKKMMKLMKPRDLLPRTVGQGFEQVCNEKVAFYTNDALKETLNFHLPCEVSYIETPRIDNLAMITPRNSEYRKLIDYHMQRFRDTGILDRLKNEYFIKMNPAESTYEPVEFWGVVPILAVLAIGFSISSIILLLEKIYYYCNPKIPMKIRKQQFVKRRNSKKCEFP